MHTQSSIKSPLNVNFKFEFLIGQGYWNFSLNSFLHLDLQVDITPDMNYLIRNHKEYLEKLSNQQIPTYDQTENWKSKTSVGIQIQTLTNKTLFLFISQVWYTTHFCNQICDSDRNFLYIEAFNSNYRRISYDLNTKNGKIIQIPGLLPIQQSTINTCCSGPRNVRGIMNENNELLLIFNMIDSDKQEKVWSYNVFTDEQTSLLMQHNFSENTNDHWIPFIKNDKFHFIYSFKPLNVLRCSIDHSECKLMSETQVVNNFSCFADGTQFIRYRNSDYFVGFAYTKVSCDECQYFYRPHVVVLSTISERFRLVYVSEPMVLDDIPMFDSFSILNDKNTSNFGYGTISKLVSESITNWEWSNDKLSFTISINNQKSFLVSVVGISEIVQSIIFAIENKYSNILLDRNLGIKMVSYSEKTAFDYCKSLTEKNKVKFKKDFIEEQNMKKNIIKDIIDSPTYPKFRVASYTDAATLKSYIQNDEVNFGIIGRYLTAYESDNRHLGQGTSMMIDAGGNHGTYALYGAALNQSVHIFEVLPKYWIVIEESLRINAHFQKMIYLHKFGVSDQYGVWSVLPGDGLTRLDFMKSGGLPANPSQNSLLKIASHPLDSFIFQKVSVMKIDVEGFEIRALKGASRAIRLFGIGAILIEIASNRWAWNNITINEGISVLEQVTSIGNYTSYIIARKDTSCPESKISTLSNVKEVKNLLLINMQNGTLENAPQIYRLMNWEPIITEMKTYDWSCNFWLESDSKRGMLKVI
ncbi:unnamed protein product [Rotaria magnacalcarata]|uniref:Methyltransferase FkbM domain-containing protein n=1 Tax=Rotaria magnacalcarata TaxID=392030 RepID=A0A816MHN1_9BILA|nr:unnamed protein product [Rotaria magnacalcarata]CAF4353562.1 unnamed protein product [Rotaria magnacalcarata]